MSRFTRLFLLSLVVLAVPARVRSQVPNGARRIEQAEIVAAMRLQRGYDLKATTNAARFKASTILQLARWAQQREPQGSLLFIDHTDMFRAYLEVTGLSAEAAPSFMRLPNQYRQDFLVDSRAKQVVEKVVKGPTPDLALNVKEWWPQAPDLPAKYSYIDTLSTPALAMTTQRVVTYRLLQINDMVIYDEIRGLSGRPTSGALGLALKVIGEASASRSKSIVLGSGIMVARAEVKKGFTVSKNVTIHPDGKTEEGLPRNLEGIEALKKRLEQPLDIDYVPYKFP